MVEGEGDQLKIKSIEGTASLYYRINNEDFVILTAAQNFIQK
jgi:hypothetical protein